MESSEADDLPLPLEVIYSCAICQATISEIYADHEGDEGRRHRTHANQDQAITKLWLTECAHLICGKHLEGGGAPFHRHDESPRASCPVCATERGDDEKKILYGIRGSLDGQFDPKIPKYWFDCPPIKLDGAGHGMDALRFHYLSLARFGTSLAHKCKREHAAAERFRIEASVVATKNHELTLETENLKKRVAELLNCEKELRPWKDRKAKIEYYLGVFTSVTRENEKLREQLTAMGYAVPNRSHVLGEGLDKITRELPPQAEDERQSSRFNHGQHTRTADNSRLIPEPEPQVQNGSSSSRTLPGPAGPVSVSTLQTPGLHVVEPRKRKVDQHGESLPEPARKSPRYRDDDSRAFMPPPPLPSERRTMELQGQDHRTHDTVLPLQRVAEQSRMDLPFLNKDVMIYQDGLRRSSEQQKYNFEGHDTADFLPRQSHNHNGYHDSQSTHFADGVERRKSPVQYYEEDRRLQHEDRRYDEGQHVTDGHARLDGVRDKQYGHNFSRSPDREGNYDVNQNGSLGGPSQRVPLQPQSQTSTNIQRFPTDDHTAHNNYSIQPPVFFHAKDQQLSSSSVFQNRQFPSTPSPRKHLSSSQIDSVTSPFFGRRSAPDYTGRLTLRTPFSPNHVTGQELSATKSFSFDSFRMDPPPKATRPTNSFGNHPPQTPSSQKSLAPCTPRDARGLFQRPDQTFAAPPPSSPYFSSHRQTEPQQNYQNRSHQQPSTPFSTRGQPFAQKISRLLPSTPKTVQLPGGVGYGGRQGARAGPHQSGFATAQSIGGTGSGSRNIMSWPLRQWAISRGGIGGGAGNGSSNDVLNDALGFRTGTSGGRSVRR